MIDSIDYEEFLVEGGNGMVLEAYEKVRKYTGISGMYYINCFNPQNPDKIHFQF